MRHTWPGYSSDIPLAKDLIYPRTFFVNLKKTGEERHAHSLRKVAIHMHTIVTRHF
jgi:hypothetical protein